MTCLVVPADDTKADEGEAQLKLSQRFDIQGTQVALLETRRGIPLLTHITDTSASPAFF